MEASNQAGGQAASQVVAQQGAESANQAAQQRARVGAPASKGVAAADTSASGVPIEDYDNLRTRSIVEQLGNLSPEELQATRAYEQENKNREFLLHMIDRRINAAS